VEGSVAGVSRPPVRSLWVVVAAVLLACAGVGLSATPSGATTTAGSATTCTYGLVSSSAHPTDGATLSADDGHAISAAWIEDVVGPTPLRARRSASDPNPRIATNSVDVMAGEGSSVVSTSRSGVTRIGDDRVSVRVGERAPVTAGEHNVVVHGNQSGLSGATQAQVNAAVAGNPAAAGCTIRFLSCFGGSNGSGQALADATGQNVWAPTSRVGIPRNGPPYPVTLDRGGEWVLLRPGGG